MKRLRNLVILLFLSTTVFLSLRFSDSYFQVSKNLDIFGSLYRELNVYYVDETKPGELMKTAIDAMLESLDPYTNYIPESMIEDYRFMTTGQYGGIGALIKKDGKYIVISDIYEGFPAQKAGLLAGDRILNIDGKSVVDKSTEEISDFLKGQPKSSVKITIERGIGEATHTFKKEIERAEIKIEDVPYFGMLNENTGYITLSSFTATASKEFSEAYKELKKNENFSQLIFDLRGNGGGLLNQAVNIANVFVEKGTKIVDTKGKLTDWNKTYHTLNQPLDLDMPVAVLINGSSASASEIVAGSLQDLDRAVIVGKTSYGKGLVQNTRPLSYNSQLKVTVAKYYIPSGRCIQKIDYSHRNEQGVAESVPDSLIASFKSLKHNRPLFDGKGIKPDVRVASRDIPVIARALLIKGLIFDYATIFHSSHDSIASAKSFTLTDAEYDSFVAFLADKDYEYETETEMALRKLKETATNESYFDPAEPEYQALFSKMKPDKKDDLNTFSAEIRELLENEIVSRYYYGRGRIEASLKKDPVIANAIEVLNNDATYQGILNGSITGLERN
jgi:carboxyl-terminal processing protease